MLHNDHDIVNLFSNLPQIAGTIGTGLFLGSGGALSEAGPLGALLAYVLVGTVAYSCVLSDAGFFCRYFISQY